MDPRRFVVPVVKDPEIEAKEAYVVMSPPFGLQGKRMQLFALLLGRHIQVSAAQKP